MENRKILHDAVWYIIDSFKSFVHYDNRPSDNSSTERPSDRFKRRNSSPRSSFSATAMAIDAPTTEVSRAMTRVKRKREAAVLLGPEIKQRRISQELSEKLDTRLLLSDDSPERAKTDKERISISTKSALIGIGALGTGVSGAASVLKRPIGVLSPISSASSLLSCASGLDMSVADREGTLEGWLVSLARLANKTNYAEFSRQWLEGCSRLEYNLDLLRESVVPSAGPQTGLDDLKQLVASIWIAVNQLSANEPDKLERYLPKWAELSDLTNHTTKAINVASDMAQTVQVPVFVYLSKLLRLSEVPGETVPDRFVADSQSVLPALEHLLAEKTRSWGDVLRTGFSFFGEQEQQLLHEARKWLLFVGLFALQHAKKNWLLCLHASGGRDGASILDVSLGNNQSRLQLALNYMLHSVQFFAKCAETSRSNCVHDAAVLETFIDFLETFVTNSSGLVVLSAPVSDALLIQTFDGVSECVSYLRLVSEGSCDGQMSVPALSSPQTPASLTFSMSSADASAISAEHCWYDCLPEAQVQRLAQSLTDAHLLLLTEYSQRTSRAKASLVSSKKALLIGVLMFKLMSNIINNIGNIEQRSILTELERFLPHM